MPVDAHDRYPLDEVDAPEAEADTLAMSERESERDGDPVRAGTPARHAGADPARSGEQARDASVDQAAMERACQCGCHRPLEGVVPSDFYRERAREMVETNVRLGYTDLLIGQLASCDEQRDPGDRAGGVDA
jgi:hypothetical protein